MDCQLVWNVLLDERQCLRVVYHVPNARAVVSQIQQWMTQPEMATTVRKTYSFENFPEALVDSATGVKSSGKVQVIVSPKLLD